MPDTLDKRRHRKDYTDLEISAGLTAMALCSGRRDRAAALLKKQGIRIPAKTLHDWATRTRVGWYERVRLDVAPALQAQLADAHQALAENAADLEAKTVERLHARLDSGEVEDKDLANIFKNAAIASGVHVDKAQLLNDRPTAIVKRELPEVLRALKAKGIEVIDADAVEEDIPQLGE